MIPAPPPGEDDPLLDSVDTRSPTRPDPSRSELGYRVLDRGGGPGPHRCRLPGRQERRRRGLGVGAVIECAACGTQWDWARGGERPHIWTRHYEHPDAPPPEPPRPGVPTIDLLE